VTSYFLLARHGMLIFVLYLAPFRRDIAGFVLMTSPLSHPNFWGVPVGPVRPCWGQH